MSKKTVLWLGFGDIGRRAQGLIDRAGFHLNAISRSGKPSDDDPYNLTLAELDDVDVLERELLKKPEVLVLTLTPAGRRADDYRSAYYDIVERLLKLLTVTGHVPSLILFVSSTSVFAQNEDVNDQSEPKPATDRAQVLRDTELLLEQSALPICILRFSGIYGPGRYHLLKQVEAGQAGSDTMTNRIHVDDCAAVIAFLLRALEQGRVLPRHLLASDELSESAILVRQWLAKALGFDESHLADEVSVKQTETSARRASMNRRIDNSVLKAMGYQFIYPSYREGFPEIVKAYLARD